MTGGATLTKLRSSLGSISLDWFIFRFELKLELFHSGFIDIVLLAAGVLRRLFDLAVCADLRPTAFGLREGVNS